MSDFAVTFTGASYGPLAVVEQLAARVQSGRMLALLGSNGSGKSTSLRAMLGAVRCRERRLTLDGQDLSRLPTYALPGRGVILVPDGARAFADLTVLENLLGAAYSVRGREGRAALDGRLDRIYDLFPVLKVRTRQLAGTLSGGERQMLALGRALMADPKVLILDEPSAGLAPKVVQELFDALRRIKAESGLAIILAEQNAQATAAVADEALVLEQGRVVLTGSMADVMQDQGIRTAYLGV